MSLECAEILRAYGGVDRDLSIFKYPSNVEVSVFPGAPEMSGQRGLPAERAPENIKARQVKLTRHPARTQKAKERQPWPFGRMLASEGPLRS
jgi:hypothetical protein